MLRDNLMILVKLGILCLLYLAFEDRLTEFLDVVTNLLVKLEGVEKALAN